MMFKTMLGVAAATTALLGAALPSAASAQAYGAYNGGGQSYDGNGYYYDPCQRSTTQRGTGGGLLGAGIGAAIGSGVSGHGARTEGTILGGVVGAIAGSAIGRNSAACRSGGSYAAPPPPPPQAYNSGGYAPSYNAQPYSSYDSYAGSSYDRGYDDQPRYEDSRYGDRRGGYSYESERSYTVTDSSRSDANGCTLAESPIYLPDGRTQKRFVRVCPDSQGRYQVVD